MALDIKYAVLCLEDERPVVIWRGDSESIRKMLPKASVVIEILLTVVEIRPPHKNPSRFLPARQARLARVFSTSQYVHTSGGRGHTVIRACYIYMFIGFHSTIA